MKKIWNAQGEMQMKKWMAAILMAGAGILMAGCGRQRDREPCGRFRYSGGDTTGAPGSCGCRDRR